MVNYQNFEVLISKGKINCNHWSVHLIGHTIFMKPTVSAFSLYVCCKDLWMNDFVQKNYRDTIRLFDTYSDIDNRAIIATLFEAMRIIVA